MSNGVIIVMIFWVGVDKPELLFALLCIVAYEVHTVYSTLKEAERHYTVNRVTWICRPVRRCRPAS